MQGVLKMLEKKESLRVIFETSLSRFKIFPWAATFFKQPPSDQGRVRLRVSPFSLNFKVFHSKNTYKVLFSRLIAQ